MEVGRCGTGRLWQSKLDSYVSRHIDGDWTVRGQESIRGEYVRLDGSLILPRGAELVLEDCTLEIVGDYSRPHSVDWKGGTLVTRNCTIGGFVNEGGTPIHTVYHLYEGLWEATDTIVQYAYGNSLRSRRVHRSLWA